MCLKSNRSVKRRDTGLVNWELLAPGYGLLVADVPPRKTSPEARSEEKQMLSQATNLENIKAKCFLAYRQPVYLNETY